MPSTILNNIKGSDLPRVWADKINIIPDKTYTVIIQPQEERQSLEKIMSEISRNANARGMTPDILEDILGEKIKHTL
jgi:phage tail sheath gpL-like